ncbi:sulfite exporter TauE/SafE family protein [Rasiella rasia]|uniref:Sulfite exporter TauE/SafE family protein n=1 Tax=Rasiella rasia TaxID=2744027 RepID=A0A6G6GMD6_9FLAO|nr:sulfite exporter TauE/SafE family protein [Rasiella rasia]QIE59719.1 sulfite exporter TauE/SafE family protein [Rasiella rasia]
MWLTALIFGLLGSFHCVGMCGPIAFLLPVDRKNPIKRVLQIVSYHLGRLVTYGIIGLLFGFLGRKLDMFGAQQYISIAIGVVMIVVILIPVRTFNRYNGTRFMYTWVGKIKSALGAELKRKSVDSFFTIGFLNGLLPCGLVYMAVFGSVAAGGAWNGSLYMVFFGLGTIPLMTAATYLGNFLNVTLKQRIVKAIPVFVVAIGVLFVLRGLGLGIPYVSPASGVAIEKISSNYSCH